MADNLKLLPCPFCGVGGAKAGAHRADCYLSLCAEIRDTPKGDLTRVVDALDVLEAWNRRAAPPVGDDGLLPLPEPTSLGWNAATAGAFGYTADQYRQGQREAYEAGCRARGITEMLMNPPYGEPDLYARLCTAMRDQIAVAKECGKLEAWFDAARSLLEDEARQHDCRAAVPAQTGTEPAGDSVDTPEFRWLLTDVCAAYNSGLSVLKRERQFIAHINAWATRRAAVSTASAPEGWKQVPIKPTPKMIDATFNDAQERHGTESHNSRNKRIYAAMLAVAPSSPVE